MKKYMTFYVNYEDGDLSEMALWATKEEALDALIDSGGKKWYLTGLQLCEMDLDANTVKDISIR